MRHPELSLNHDLHSERFDLEPLSAETAQLFAGLAADTEIIKSLIGDWSTAAKRLDNARAWIDDEHYYVIWGIHDREGKFGKRGGFVGICGVETPLPEVGKGPGIFYAVCQPVWGRGVGSEVAAAVIDHLFDNMGVDAVEALVYPHLNPASERLLKKQGMRLVGRYPFASYVGEDCLPTVQYEIWRAQVALPVDALACIEEVAFKIGQFVGDGISSRDEMAAALLISAHENGLVDKVGINETRQVIDKALNAGMAEDGWLYYRLESADRPSRS